MMGIAAMIKPVSKIIMNYFSDASKKLDVELFCENKLREINVSGLEGRFLQYKSSVVERTWRVSNKLKTLDSPIFRSCSDDNLISTYLQVLDEIEKLIPSKSTSTKNSRVIMRYCEQIIETYPLIRELYLLTHVWDRLMSEQNILDNIEFHVFVNDDGELALSKEFGRSFAYIQTILDGRANVTYPYCPAFDQLIEEYERNQEYDKAIAICEQAIYFNAETKFNIGFREIIQALKAQITALSKISVSSLSEMSMPPDELISWDRPPDILMPDPSWMITISFAKSRSTSFGQALFLATMATEYLETEHGGDIVYQASFSQEPREYLKFIELYELISSWKSCSVSIYDKLVDRKVVGSVNYCYGDRCRFGNPSFCDGASEMTANPFGCHRLQISASNHPWLSFVIPQKDGSLRVDKKRMKDRIDSFARVYSLCPVFSYPKILQRLACLPDVLRLHEYKRLVQQSGIHTTLGLKFALFPSEIKVETVEDLRSKYTER